jgi:hypothetical protein
MSARLPRLSGVRPVLVFLATALAVAVVPAVALAGTDRNTNIPGFEPHASVVNPRNPSQVAVGQGCTVVISNDFGQTFPVTRNTTTGCNGDISLAFDSTGRLFVTHLARQGADNELTVMAGQIADTTTTGNQGFTPAAVSANDGNDDDKEWLVTDPNPASPFRDNLYLVWTRFTGTGAASGGPTAIVFSRSLNQGGAWSAQQVVSQAGDGFVWPSHAAVAANGDLYLAYHTQTCGAANTGTIELLRDGSGGAAFAAGTVPQRTQPFTAGQATVTCNRQNDAGDGTAGDEIPGADFWLQGSVQPWILPDPARAGNVYVVGNDDPNNNFGNGDDADVFIARSADFGITFALNRVDHGPGQTFAVMPTAHIDQDGTIGVHWYDNRRLLQNTGANANNGNANFLLDLYGTASRDGGVTFAEDVRVSDAPFDPDQGANCRFGTLAAGTCTTRIGEYNGIWSVDGIGYAAWTGNNTPPAAPFPSNGAGGQSTYFDLFSLAGLFPDGLEPNESADLGVATDLGSVEATSLDNLTIHTATDEDWFRVVAARTGSLLAQIKSTAPVADLDLQVEDRFGNAVATSTAALDSTNLESLGIPVVKGQPYFLRVFGQANQQAPQQVYDLSLVNTEAPVPFSVNLLSASDSGRSDTDDVTNDNTPTIRARLDDSSLVADGVSFSPTSDSNLADDSTGFKVEILNDGASVGFASQVSPAIYELTPTAGAINEGSNNVTARVVIVDPSNDPATAGVDHAVGRAAQSDGLEVFLDTVAPPVPPAPDLLPTSDSGSSDTDNHTRVNPPAFQGTGEVNAQIRVRADGSLVGQGVIGTDGTDGISGNGVGAWEVTIEPLNDGTFTITAEAEDLAGNISGVSAAMGPDLVLDTPDGGGAPQRPTIDLVNAFDTGRFDLDNVTSLSDLEVRISAEPGNTVVIKDGNTVIDTFVMPAADFTTRSLSLTDGPHPLSTESEDPAGNRSHQSEELLTTVDTAAPAAPSVPNLLDSSDTAGVSIDNITTIQTPAFGGSAEPNALVRIFANGLLEGQDVVTSGGAYEVALEPLDDGVHVIFAHVEDLAGNVSAVSGALPVTIAHDSLTLSGATGPVAVDLTIPTVTGYPAIPGGIAGIRGIPTVNLDAAGHALAVTGTSEDDAISFTPTGSDGGRLTRAGSTQLLRLGSVGGTFSVDPAAGVDQVNVIGTADPDLITGTVDTVNSIQVGGFKTLTAPAGSTESLGIEGRLGLDRIDIGVRDSVSEHLIVNGGEPLPNKPNGDELNITALSPRPKMQNMNGPLANGSAFISWPRTTGEETRIDYADVEKVRMLK